MRKHCAVFGFKRTLFVAGKATGASEPAASSGSTMHWVGRTLKITLKFKPGIKEKKKPKQKTLLESSMNMASSETSTTKTHLCYKEQPIFSTV